jgi:predicted nucleic acid-binding protein
MNPTPDDFREAASLVRRYRDQSLSMFDAVAAVVGSRLSLPIWTYDHHFDVVRVEVWRDA